MSGQALHEEKGQAALWTQACVNRGSLGSPSLLISSLTLINGEDTITVQALWDPGSESSFFASDLLPFATNQRDVSFKLETLSASATQAETVHGLEAAFQVQVPEGETVTLRLLQHAGLELRGHKLKSKILTCSTKFASKYNLERAEPCFNGQSCLKKTPAKLSLILGQDLHHVAPQLVEKFSDKYGSMSIYTCSLSQKLITAGNRMYPYTEKTARTALSDTNSFGGATDDTSDPNEDNLSYLPTTALLHSALQEAYPIAVRLGQNSPTLQFPEDLPNIHANAAASTASASSSRSSRTPSATTTPSTPPPAGTATTSPTPERTSTGGWASLPGRGLELPPGEGLESPLGQGLTPPPGTGRAPSTSTTSTAGLVPPLGRGLEPPQKASRRPPTTATRATGVLLAGWQGGQVSAQGGGPPPPVGRCDIHGSTGRHWAAAESCLLYNKNKYRRNFSPILSTYCLRLFKHD